MTMLSRHDREQFGTRLGDQAVVTAFDALTEMMAGTGIFELAPNIQGQKKSLHFKTGTVSYFATIANREWLLWYFRRPGLRDGIFTFEELVSHFPDLDYSKRRDPEKTEGLLRLRNLADVDRVMRYVRLVLERIPKS